MPTTMRPCASACHHGWKRTTLLRQAHSYLHPSPVVKHVFRSVLCKCRSGFEELWHKGVLPRHEFSHQGSSDPEDSPAHCKDDYLQFEGLMVFIYRALHQGPCIASRTMSNGGNPADPGHSPHIRRITYHSCSKVAAQDVQTQPNVSNDKGEGAEGSMNQESLDCRKSSFCCLSCFVADVCGAVV